jgi:NTP pyrophosphatase (non-canonical NTP hydrolase)
MPNLGDRATCAACQQPIEWRGENWAHLGEHQPRHIAEPIAFEPSNEPVELPFKRRMSADEYQQQAARTLIDGPDAAYSAADIMLVWNALGLTGEAGEVADTIKKAVFHQHGLDRDELIKELGDVLWYVAALCSKLDVSMSEVMERNIVKLKARYPQGYSADASKARLDLKD